MNVVKIKRSKISNSTREDLEILDKSVSDGKPFVLLSFFNF